MAGKDQQPEVPVIPSTGPGESQGPLAGQAVDPVVAVKKEIQDRIDNVTDKINKLQQDKIDHPKQADEIQLQIDDLKQKKQDLQAKLPDFDGLKDQAAIDAKKAQQEATDKAKQDAKVAAAEAKRTEDVRLDSKLQLIKDAAKVKLDKQYKKKNKELADLVDSFDKGTIDVDKASDQYIALMQEIRNLG